MTEILTGIPDSRVAVKGIRSSLCFYIRAKFYSSILLIVNLYYYWINTSGLNFVLGVFLSFIIPISIFNVAEEVATEFNAVAPVVGAEIVKPEKQKRKKITELNPEE